jgi:hypothetical protein
MNLVACAACIKLHLSCRQNQIGPPDRNRGPQGAPEGSNVNHAAHAGVTYFQRLGTTSVAGQAALGARDGIEVACLHKRQQGIARGSPATVGVAKHGRGQG